MRGRNIDAIFIIRGIVIDQENDRSPVSDTSDTTSRIISVDMTMRECYIIKQIVFFQRMLGGSFI